MARSCKYNPEKAEKVLNLLSTTSRGLRSICKELKLSPTSVYDWITGDQKLCKDFGDRYARAREIQADLLVEEMIEIADDSSRDTKTIIDKQGNPIEVEDTEWTRRSQLRVDTRKFIAAKLRPKKYGDKLDVTQTIVHEQPLFPDEVQKKKPSNKK